MKGLSIRQPWASLIALGIKDIENRDWRGKPAYRGQLLIHASKTFDTEGLGVATKILYNMDHNRYDDPITRGGLSLDPKKYPRGGFIGLCYLNDVVDYDDSPWFFGPLGFKLRQQKQIEFIPYKGQLGLFDIPDDIIRKIEIKT